MAPQKNPPVIPPSVNVAVAIVERRGCVLIGRRAAGSRYAGWWEFPGGKVERDETFEAAAIRELLEETGIDALAVTPLHRSENLYPDGGRFMAEYFLITRFEGEPATLVHEELRWVEPAVLNTLDMLSGNVHVIELLSRRANEGTPQT